MKATEMAKEKPEVTPIEFLKRNNWGDPALGAPMLVATIDIKGFKQTRLFQDGSDPGLDQTFVEKSMAKIVPLVLVAANELASKLQPVTGVRVCINQITTSNQLSLMVVCVKATPFSDAEVKMINDLSPGTQDRINLLVEKFNSPEPLVRSAAEENDKGLKAVAKLKSRGIKFGFAYKIHGSPPGTPDSGGFIDVLPRKTPGYAVATKSTTDIFSGIILKNTSNSITISRTDGKKKQIVIKIPQDSDLACKAYACSFGGVVKFIVEKSETQCVAAPEIKKTSHKLRDIVIEDTSAILHLETMLDATKDLISAYYLNQGNAQRPQPQCPPLTESVKVTRSPHK